ncbi:MAG TPA: hypothetical protein DD379_19775 [Cyanobacteria bacterium UBA11162]|nr:hypothetical protein [Cyanobacteria bacterium UBA11162]
MRKKLFGKVHPDVASSMNNLAGLYNSLGRHWEAEPLYVNALAMWKRLFGEIYPNVASSMNNLATLFAATHRYPEALDLMKQATTIQNRLISQSFSYSCESDRLAYLQTIRPNFDIFLSLISQHLPNSPEAKQAALDVILQRKAITAAALAAQNQALSSGRYPHLQPELNKLRELSDQISHYIYHQPQPELIPQLQAEYNNLQKKLAAEIPEIRLQDQTIDHHAIALALPPDSILIEFVCFDVFDFHVAKESQWQPTRYLAFILPAAQPNQIEMIDLGEAEPINQLIHQFRQYVSDSNLAIHSLDMGGDSADDEELTQLPPAAKELREKIFDPLRPYLNLSQPGKTPTLQIAPDGNLNLVPFQILPLDETGEKLLMDEYSISYLSVGRDALRSKIKIERPASVPLVIADPDFDLSEATLATDGVTDVADGEVVGELVQTLAGSIFQQTTGTRFLGESVANLLKVSPYLDKNAFASHLTNCQSPEILLIATHGYFNPEKQQQDYLKFIFALIDCPNGEEEKLIQQHRHLIDPTLLELIEEFITLFTEDGNLTLANKLKTLTQDLTPKPKIPNPDSPIQNPKSKIQNSPDPMLRSALAFAGANRWLQGKPLPKPAGKGMVFAQDIAALDLWATELAVLCACQTGIGDIKLGEGVFGLRRAFAAAGTKTLLISLWSVPDRATALLMDRFFSNLHQGLGRAAALEDAQNYIRTITVQELQQSPLGRHVLDELNKFVAHSNEINSQTDYFSQDDTPLAHPYFWGAWVCQGDTTPMTLSINTAIQFEV